MDKVAAVQRANERELALGLSEAASWHGAYADSAWVYVGGLSPELSEGDVICVLSQFGEVEDLNLPRDDKTGKPRGWCWCKYEDQRSTVLAVDNFTGVTLLGRTLRVDHCEKYKLPKELKDRDDKYESGAIYKHQDLASAHTLARGQDVFAPASVAQSDDRESDDRESDDHGGKSKKTSKKKKKKEDKKKKKEPKKKKKKREKDDDLVLPLRKEDEAILREEQLTLPVLAEDAAKDDVALSWRGVHEPGAAQPRSSDFSSFGGQPRHHDEKKRPRHQSNDDDRDEREAARNRTYGGMLRRR